jgi:hypothetical protein
MEPHRLAIAVMALLLAASIGVAAGRIPSAERSSSSHQVPTSAARYGQEPVVRLGAPRQTGSTAPVLLAQPTPPAEMTQPARQARESSSPESVIGDGG